MVDKLALIQFIKSTLLEAGYAPLDYKQPIRAGITTVVHNGQKYLAIKQETMGWVWLLISGPSIPKHNVPTLKEWDDPIYTERRYDEAPVDVSKLLRRIKTTPTTPILPDRNTVTVNIPEAYRTPEGAYTHAKYDLHGPYRAGEHYIFQSPKYATLYAILCGQRMWKAEAVIQSSIDWALKYAIEVLRERWPAIEPDIIKYPYYIKQYCDTFNLTLDPTTKTFRSK